MPKHPRGTLTRWRRFGAAWALRLVLAGAGLGGVAVAVAAWARLTTPQTVTVVDWPSDGPGFGGWSALDLGPEGRAFVAVSDGGTFTRGVLVRDAAGRLLGVKAPRPEYLGGIRVGDPEKREADSEGIDLGAHGRIAVSFERWNRVWRYGDLAAPPVERLPDAAFAELPVNGGLEAVAADGQGRLVALAEGRGGLSDPTPLYRHDGTAWRRLGALAPEGRPRPVGADLGPGGLYVLERGFWGLGFSSRIRRVDLSAPGHWMRGEVVYRAPFGRHGNVEGLAVWRDATGATRATLVTDNNHRWFQRQDIVEIVLPPLARDRRSD